MILSAGARALFERLSAPSLDQAAPQRAEVLAIGPTIVKLDDPMEDAEKAVEALDEADAVGRRRNRWLARHRKKWQGLRRDEAGVVTYDGRACCGDLITRINTSLHVIAIPSDYLCSCGASYRVQYLPREERRHE